MAQDVRNALPSHPRFILNQHYKIVCSWILHKFWAFETAEMLYFRILGFIFNQQYKTRFALKNWIVLRFQAFETTVMRYCRILGLIFSQHFKPLFADMYFCLVFGPSRQPKLSTVASSISFWINTTRYFFAKAELCVGSEPSKQQKCSTVASSVSFSTNNTARFAFLLMPYLSPTRAPPGYYLPTSRPPPRFLPPTS